MSEATYQELRALGAPLRAAIRHGGWLDAGIDLSVLTILWFPSDRSFIWSVYLGIWTLTAAITQLYVGSLGVGLVARMTALVRTLLVWGMLAAALGYVAPSLAVDRATGDLYVGKLVVSLITLRIVHRLLLETGLIVPKDRRALIVGDGEVARLVVRQIASKYGRFGVRVLGCLPPTKFLTAGTEELCESDLTVLLDQIRDNAADEVLITADDCGDVLARNIAEGLRWQGIRVSLIPRLDAVAIVRPKAEMIAGMPVLTLTNTVLTRSQRSVKRGIDLLVSSILTVIAAPFMCLIAVLVKLDSPGPALFVQERVGESGRRFKIFKFRTMRQNAGDDLQLMIRMVDGKPVHKFPNDPRVTRTGRWLRSTSLDELPQLINVLRGEMSLVGPRPELPCIVEKYEPWQFSRLAVPPGITGWWQLSGRSQLPMHLNTEYDLFYIERYSIMLDLKLLLRTLFVPFYRKGAY